MVTTRFDVPEISCEHCKTSIEGAVGPIAGVDSVTVNIPAKTVTIDHDPVEASVDRLVETIEEQGYDVHRRHTELSS